MTPGKQDSSRILIGNGSIPRQTAGQKVLEKTSANCAKTVRSGLPEPPEIEYKRITSLKGIFLFPGRRSTGLIKFSKSSKELTTTAARVKRLSIVTKVPARRFSVGKKTSACPLPPSPHPLFPFATFL